MRVLTVRVQGVEIPVFQDGIDQYWPIRFASEAIGIGWGAQYAKVQSSRYNPKNIEFLMPGKSRTETHVCLPKHEFEFWLKTINARKVSSEARRRLAILRGHFFAAGASAIVSNGNRAQSAMVMDRLIRWKLKFIPYEQHPSVRNMIEKRFIDAQGYSVHEVSQGELLHAISAMSKIIYSLDKFSDVGDLSVSARVDAFIDKVVSESGRGSGVEYAMGGALLSAIELERAQSA